VPGMLGKSIRTRSGLLFKNGTPGDENAEVPKKLRLIFHELLSNMYFHGVALRLGHER